jgi:hypothetical protein
MAKSFPVGFQEILIDEPSKLSPKQQEAAELQEVEFLQQQRNFRKEIALCVKWMEQEEMKLGRKLTDEEKCEFGLVPAAESADIDALVAQAKAEIKALNPLKKTKATTTAEATFNARGYKKSPRGEKKNARSKKA